ncbi:MAG: transcriptional regulator GutM [Ktedonobacteraceae bacterium]|jgi:glucitol operon activator protein
MIQNIAIIAVLAWFVQLGLAYRQARLFYKRVSSLRKLGVCATGLAGGRYRGRVYVVLVAHPLTHKIIKAEQMHGLTVFATLKPISQLEGYIVDELVDSNAPPIEGISQRLQEAARSAAEAIQKTFDKVPATA